MPNEILHKTGTPIVIADATDWPSGGAHGFGNDNYQIDLTSLANGAARQSAKIDFGATRARLYAVRVGIEVDVAPTAGTLIEFYLSPSASDTAGTGNDGGASGADGAYKAGEEDEWKRQLVYLGALVLTADAAPTVQIGTIGLITPPERYGSIVVVNKSGQALEGDAAEMFIALVPIKDEVQ